MSFISHWSQLCNTFRKGHLLKLQWLYLSKIFLHFHSAVWYTIGMRGQAPLWQAGGTFPEAEGGFQGEEATAVIAHLNGMLECAHTNAHTHFQTLHTHLQMWGKWGSFGCMRMYASEASHTLADTYICSLSRAHTFKMCRKWGEEALDAHIKMRAAMCVNAYSCRHSIGIT